MQLYLAAAPERLARAQEFAVPTAHAAYRINSAGRLVSRDLPQQLRGGLLMLSDRDAPAAFQPELLYNVKGFNWNDLNEGDGSAAWDKAKYGYVEVPLQLQWGIDLVMLRPYAFVEPFAGYAVSGKKWINSGEANKIDFENAKSRLEYGLGVGAGLEVMSKVQLSFKYFWNFENAQSFAEIKDTVKEGKSFNGLIFSVGLFF